MTHLFLVKSWITYLVARAVIRHEGIDPSDVVFLAVRGFEIEAGEATVVELPYGPGTAEPFPKLERSGPWNYVRTLPRLRRFDRFIARATRHRPFHYYSTNTRQRYNRVITSHPGCRGHSFLECGLISYRTREEIEAIYPSRVQKQRDRRYYRNRIAGKSYYDDGYSRMYGVGPLAFPGFERRVELLGTFDTASATAAMPVDPSQIDIVLVFDGLSAHRLISLGSVLHATRRVFDHFRQHGVQRVHYKFHPAQTHAGEDRQLEPEIRRIAKDVQTERLPEALMLEELAHARPDVHFYVGVSSIALYAAQAGCRITSYANYVAEFEDGFDRTIDALPTGWKQAVDFLEA